MQPDQLRISAATGVDVTLEIAGAGSRAYAFIIDWHIRLVVAIAWAVIGLLVTGGLSLRREMHPGYFAIIVPPFLIYFFYHPLLETLMRGRTPGKRMAGVRIATQLGATPSTGALLVRNVFRIVDCLPSFYVVGLVTCLVTPQRVRFGDMAAGTLLVRDDDRTHNSLAHIATLSQSSPLDPTLIDLMSELLTRWPDLEDAQRVSLARALLARAAPAENAESLTSPQLRDRVQALLRGANA